MQPQIKSEDKEAREVGWLTFLNLSQTRTLLCLTIGSRIFNLNLLYVRNINLDNDQNTDQNSMLQSGAYPSVPGRMAALQ